MRRGRPIPWVNHATVKGQTLALESDGPEELRMTDFVCIAKRHEHAGEVAPVRSYFFQSCRKGPLVLDDLASHLSSNT